MTEKVEPADQVDLLQVDFEGVEAEESDIPTMAKLLGQSLRETGIDVTQLAKILVSQNYIGSVLKPSLDDIDLDDDEDPQDEAVYAITSIVNLTSRKEDETVKEIIKFVKSGGTKTTNQTKIFEEIFDDSGKSCVGLLIKERMTNMPLDLVCPSMISLVQDLETAMKKKMPYKFTHFVYFSKHYSFEGVQQIHSEDEWFSQNSVDYFTFHQPNSDTVQVTKENGETDGAPRFIRVSVLEYSKLVEFIAHLKTLVGQVTA